jgi:tetratricopeptide (TPR) repeat protein
MTPVGKFQMEKVSRCALVVAGSGIVLAALLVYANTFAVPFLFDDEPSILENPTILHLWPWWDALTPPNAFGVTVSGRPLLNLSLAINYAISGYGVWSYHAFNLLIHALAGLTLFGLMRRTLARPPLQEKFGRLAFLTAFTTALLWTIHPLQTESVTYVIQRAESLMGLFYLLTLYCFVRSIDSEHSRTWQGFALFACTLGMGCKEVMATAPLVVLLYDRTFAAGSFRAAGRKRLWFYLGLMLTWLPLAWLVVRAGGDRGGTFVLTRAATQHYWLTQFEAVTRYLQLAAWPRPLIFDYGFPVTYPLGRAVWYVLPLLAALGLALWTFVRRPVVGFLAVSFFLVLAPTSLVPGFTQYTVEHRMYLPLAAVVVLGVGGAVHWFGRGGLAWLLGIAVAFGALTVRRNFEYRSEHAIWEATVQRSPESAKAQTNFGRALDREGQRTAAISHYEKAIQLDPVPAQPYYNLGLALAASGRVEEAIPQFQGAIQRLPGFVQARYKLAMALMEVGRRPEAVPLLEEVATFNPWTVETHGMVGEALAELGRLPEAVLQLEAALRLQPDFAEGEGDLGAVLHRLGNLREGQRHLERAVQLNPRMAEAHFNLGLIFAETGQAAEARAQYAEAVRIDPTEAEAQLNLGIMLAREEKFPEAEQHLLAARRLRPALAAAHGNLGIVLAELGRFDEAILSYAEALRLQPDYAVMHYNLANALLHQQRGAEAMRHLEDAVHLAPDFAPARQLFEQLQAAGLRP